MHIFDIFDVAINRLDSVGDTEEEGPALDKLQMKERRHKKAMCEDIYELYIFSAGLKDTFPKEILHRSAQSGLLVPLGSKTKNTSNNPNITEQLEIPNILQLATELTATKDYVKQLELKYERIIEALKTDLIERLATVQELIPSATNQASTEEKTGAFKKTEPTKVTEEKDESSSDESNSSVDIPFAQGPPHRLPQRPPQHELYPDDNVTHNGKSYSMSCSYDQ